jgi:putative acetyltransferase
MSDEFALRPLLPEDVPLLAEIFRASVQELTSGEYDAGQQDAWSSSVEDEEEFAGRLAGALTLVAIHEGEPVGFISLVDNEQVDLFYVHPDAAGQGAGAMLYDALEKLATNRGAKILKVDTSDTAREFFQKRGFVAVSRNSISMGDEWLPNTTMEKKLNGAVQ